ncbi:phage portal protein family protein [Aurantibacillus circumpalustris]|uniref:phage portal protein family protein n=1 Tax=Aurantibacillus circumpalustris TaxID=3036359 RepID=UPI00295B72F5|nr:DUF935 family protein [Aurantibacillus circumpalustris]
MADKQYSKIGKSINYVSSLSVAPIRMQSQDIGNWVTAVNCARDIRMPRRRLLYELFDNIRQDGKVATVMQKRKVAITNKNFVFYNKNDEGTTVDRIQDEIIDMPWFDEMLEILEEEDFYGHELMEFVPDGKGGIESVIQIPHANVVPETGLLLPNYMDTTNGVLFRGPNADPQVSKYLLEFGKQKNYGLLMSMAQYVIYKRGGFGDWAEFAELFGRPFRVGKYNPLDPTSRKLLSDALRIMGGAGFGVIPEGTTLEFIQSNFGSGQSGIFKDLTQACNDEIAQIGLGGTMTTDNGSSLSQSETHLEGENAIVAARLKKIIKFLNGPFRKMISGKEFKYKEAENGYFKVDRPEIIGLKDRIEIDMQVATQVNIKPEYWYEKYDLPKPDNGELLKQAPTTPPDLKNENAKAELEKKKTKLSARLNAYYTPTCSCCAPLSDREGHGVRLDFNTDIEKLTKLIFDGKLKPGTVDKELINKTASKLLEAITKGYLRHPSDFTEADKNLIAFMQENVFIFSGFKTENMLREASDLLLDATGTLRPFNDFKEQILQLDAKYNVTYLAAEYNHAVASSQMASKWLNFQELKEDFPNLKYSTAGDARVRDAHAVLNGLIIPMDDPRVDAIYPVKDFGCRCDMDATDEEPNDTKYKINPSSLGPFKNNVGKDGIVFPESHPYYETSKTTAKGIVAATKALYKQTKK